MKCVKCGDVMGWFCESHPDKPWPHDECAGPGMPCDEPGCEHSLFGTTPQTPGIMARMAAGVEARGGKVICSTEDIARELLDCAETMGTFLFECKPLPETPPDADDPDDDSDSSDTPLIVGE